MSKETVLRKGIKILGTLTVDTSDPLLTRDPSTSQIGERPPIDSSTFLTTTLQDGRIIIGNSLNIATAVLPTGQVTITNTGVTSITPDTITNAQINSAAGILYSKLSLANSIVNNDISPAANIARTKLASGNINRVLINDGSGVMSELPALTVNRALVSGATGLPEVSTVTSTELGYSSGVTSSIQTQLGNRLSFSSGIVPVAGDIIQFAGGVWTRLGIGSAGQVLTVVSGAPAWAAGGSGFLPSGGSANQYLRKIDGTDFNVTWDTLALAKITDVTASASQVNVLATGFYDATSSVQTQIDGKLSSSLTTDNILKGVGGIATATTDLPTGITIGAQYIYRTNGTDVALADGGTGSTLVDPGADRILFWDESANQVTWLTAGSGLTITGTTIDVTSAPVADGDKGDITVSSSGTVWTIDTDITKTWTGTHVFTTNQVISSLEDSGTNTILYPHKFRRTSSATPANGIGVGIQFEVETGVGNNEIGGAIEAVTTDVTSTSEDFDLIYKSMVGGSLTTLMRMNKAGLGGIFPAIQTTDPLTVLNRGLRIEYESSLTNAVQSVLNIEHRTTGIPAAGIGTSIILETETSAGNLENGVILESVTTDVTATSEDFKFVIKTMAAGAAAASRVEVDSSGLYLINTPLNDDALTQVLVRDTGTGLIKYRNESSLLTGAYWKTAGTSTLTADVTIAQGGFNNSFLNGNSLFGPTGATITASTRLDVRGVASGNVERWGNDANTTLGAFQNDGIFYIGSTPVSGGTDLFQMNGSLAGSFGAHFRNTSNAAAANAELRFQNDGSNVVVMQYNSSARAAYGGVGSFNIIHAGGAPLTLGTNNAVRYTISSNGTHTWTTSQSAGTFTHYSMTQASATSGGHTGFSFTAGAHTNQTASEFHDWNLNFSANAQFTGSTGFSTLRTVRIQPRTYSFGAATGTITTAATVSIGGPPIAGTNAIITNPWALNIESGNLGIQSGNLVFGTSGSFIGESGGDGTAIDFDFTNNEIGVQGDAENYINIQGASTDNIIYQSDNHRFRNGAGNSTATISSTGNLTLGSGVSGVARDIIADGSGANVGLNIYCKGTGSVLIYPGLAGGSGAISLSGLNSSTNIGAIATFSETNLLLQKATNLTNTVAYGVLSHVTTGTPAAGIGVGLQFETETASSNNEVGAVIEAITTDVTSTSEDFDLVFRTMAGGAAAAERFRITSQSNYGFNGATTFDTGVGVLGIKNAGTAPAAGDADQCIIYCKDVSSSSEFFVMDESGFETQIS